MNLHGLRQYKRVREELGSAFTYKKIQKVYTIVLFEKSNVDFYNFSREIYIHHFEQRSDTGVTMNLLQEYTFICLDIFDDIIHNEDRKIENRLDYKLKNRHRESIEKLCVCFKERNCKYQQNIYSAAASSSSSSARSEAFT